MARQSKAQQVQFFDYCLLPNYNVEVDELDLWSEVDSSLTTGENWALLDQQYNISDQNCCRMDFEEMSYKHLARQIREETGLDPDYTDLKELDVEGLLEQPGQDYIVQRLCD